LAATEAAPGRAAQEEEEARGRLAEVEAEAAPTIVEPLTDHLKVMWFKRSAF
jgi:hypothetical protein